MPAVSKLRLASSIILTRNPESASDVYLVQRGVPQLRFMGGFWAFPGGIPLCRKIASQVITPRIMYSLIAA